MAGELMNVKFLNPFVDAAYDVLQAETGLSVKRGELSLDKEPYSTDDLTVIISMIGRVIGNVIYSMDKDTALDLASRMMNEPVKELESLAQSSIAELGNVITGRASVSLSTAGYDAIISTPTLLLGRGAVISTLDFARLMIPLTSESGTVTIHLALREGTQEPIWPGKSIAIEGSLK
jgi:chemotaxis protein CheX